MTVATRLIDKLKMSNIRVFTGSGTITMVNEGVLVVKKAIGASTAVTLTPSPETGDFIFIKDGKGDAASNNITLTPASGNVDGAATYVISENYGAVLLHYSGTEWQVVSQTNAVSAAELGFINGVTAGTAAASKAVVLDSALNISTINAATITNLTSTTGTITNAALTNITGALNLTNANTLPATGTVITNAATVISTVTDATGADNTVGVVLPATVAGKVFFVYSSTATSGLKVYPPVNSAINGGTANANIVIEGKTLAIFVATNSTNWASIFTLNT